MSNSKARDSSPAGDTAPANAVLRFIKNVNGRDFVVGDIHGMFAHLQQLLDNVSFNPERDRLFSVGDLVDRGPSSSDALAWLEHPWFFACRGNHEQFALDSGDPEQLDLWIHYNGGEWWLDLSESEQDTFRGVFEKLPLAMEIETETGMVGIVHADTQPLVSWERFMDLLGARDKDAMFYAIWSRMRISGEFTQPVAGRMDRIYCGHTPIRETVLVGNVYFIDTGAVYSNEGYVDACLTLVEIHPDRHVVHTINTYD